MLICLPPEPDGRYLVAFRLLGDRLVGKWFPGPFRARELHSRLEGWEEWPLLEGEDLAKAEAAERAHQKPPLP